MEDRPAAIHQAMVAAGFARRRGLANMRFEGQLKLSNGNATVSIEFADSSLTKLPKLRLLKRHEEMPGVVAHIEADGVLCYAQEAELALFPDNPRRTVGTLLEIMRQATDRVARLDLSDEIAREFPQHWLGHSNVYVCDRWTEPGLARFVTLTDRTTPISILVRQTSGLLRFGVDPAKARLLFNKAAHAAVMTTATQLTFHRPMLQPETFAQFRDWLEGIDAGAGHRARDALLRLPGTPLNDLRIFIAAPNGVVGAQLFIPPLLRRAIDRKGFLGWIMDKKGGQLSMQRLSGVSTDIDTVLGRNLAGQPSLAGRKIALIGIGTIGSHLAKFLSQSGAGAKDGHLLLLDEQRLSPGNIGRHLLTLADVGQPKAQACCALLRSGYPDLHVTAFTINALTRMDDLMEFDLVIDATGDRGFSTVLAEAVVNRRRSGAATPAMLHCWLVGSGVAAQVLLHDSSQAACIRCLTTDGTRDRFQVLRDTHPAAIVPANCGEGAYFAYGVSAPAIASGLATQLTLDWAAGRGTPRFRTVRIGMDATMAVRDHDPSKLQGCPVCAG